MVGESSLCATDMRLNRILLTSLPIALLKMVGEVFYCYKIFIISSLFFNFFQKP